MIYDTWATALAETCIVGHRAFIDAGLPDKTRYEARLRPTHYLKFKPRSTLPLYYLEL